MAKPKKKVASKPPKAKKAKKGGRRAASQTPAGVGHNMPPAEYQAALEEAVQEVLDIKTAAEKDAAGYRGDIAASLEANAKKIGIRQGVLKDEINRAWSAKKRLEQEKAMDPIERQQREALRAAMEKSDKAWNGTPFGDLFSGDLADAEDGGGEDGDAEDGEEGKTEGD